ncbi:MAG: hypothetical protein LBN43_07905 [Oscillospiraceae bacterium]|jgi:hypothetical protein|nr:hypothetical protein [Oscillospiraceae bacterium]
MKPKKYRPQEERVELTPDKLRSLLLGIPYPIIILIIYLCLGFLLRLWHPLWLLFLTIPVYYMLAANRVFVELIYSAWQKRVQESEDNE